MDVTVALLADYANVSREGKLNIMGIFNRVNVHSLPARHPEMKLVLRLEASPAELGREHAIEIRCMDADGEDLFRLEGTFVLQADASPTAAGHVDHILDFKDLTFKKVGGHTFAVFIDNDLKTQVPLEVSRTEEGPPLLPGT